MESAGENYRTHLAVRALFVALSLDDDQILGCKK